MDNIKWMEEMVEAGAWFTIYTMPKPEVRIAWLGGSASFSGSTIPGAFEQAQRAFPHGWTVTDPQGWTIKETK